MVEDQFLRSEAIAVRDYLLVEPNAGHKHCYMLVSMPLTVVPYERLKMIMFD